MPKLSLLGVDARFLSTGLGTYIYNVIRNLGNSGEFRLRVVTRPEHRDALAPYCDEMRFVTAGMYTATEQLSVAKAAAGCDLFHSPHYNIPLLYRGALIVTIHDLTHLLHMSLQWAVKSVLYARPMLRIATSRAAHVITVSEYSKVNLMRLLKVPEEKISVIPNGVAPQFQPMDEATCRVLLKEILSFDGPYILFLGNLKGHKNVEGLLRAYALLCTRMSTDCKLLIVGEDVVGGPALRQLATDLRLEKKVVFMPRVNSEHLRTLYCGATLTVLPSFEEGFGLTVLESMACGTPVACSRRASMPEVGGEAVQYFDPGSDDSIAQAMQTVLSSGTRRRDLRELGLLQARQYRWSSSAQEHLRLYWKYLYRDFPLRGRPAESAFHNTAP